jgi:hypothetical protein
MTITYTVGERDRVLRSSEGETASPAQDDALASIVAALRTTPQGDRALFILQGRNAIDAPAAHVIRREAASQGLGVAFVTSHPASRRALGREGISTFRHQVRAERSRWHRVTLPTPSRRRPVDLVVVVPSGPGIFQKPSPSGFRPFSFVRSYARRPSPWWQTLALLLALGLLLASLLYALMAVIPAAEIVVTPDSEPVEARVDLQAVPGARTDTANGIVPAQTVSVQVSGDARTKTTGRRSEPAGKALGRVVYINMTNRQITVPQGTVVSTATGNNVQFGTLEATELGPNGRAVAQVEALLPGPDGNARAGTVTRVEGPLSLSVAVSNDAGFAGGTTAPQPVVTEEDKTRLQAQLFEELKSQALDKLVERGAQGTFISPESIQFLPLSPTFTPFVGEVSEDLFLSMSVQAVGLAVDQTEANKAALAKLQEAMPPGTRLISDTIRFIPGSVVAGEDGGVGFSVTGEGMLLRPVETNAIRSAVLGMDPERAAGVVQERFSLARPPTITLGPDWLPYVVPLNLPSLPWRIRVVVDWDEAARLAMKP